MFSIHNRALLFGSDGIHPTGQGSHAQSAKKLFRCDSVSPVHVDRIRGAYLQLSQPTSFITLQTIFKGFSLRSFDSNAPQPR